MEEAFIASGCSFNAIDCRFRCFVPFVILRGKCSSYKYFCLASIPIKVSKLDLYFIEPEHFPQVYVVSVSN